MNSADDSRVVDHVTSDVDFAAATRQLDSLCGQAVWGTALGWGSFLSLNFGPPLDDDPDFGVSRLWIEQAAWRWETADRILAASEDPRDVLARSVTGMNSLVLTAVRVEFPSMSARFDFDNGSRLRTFTIHTRPGQDMEHWMMFLPDSRVFVAGPGGEWSLDPANAADQQPEAGS